jgi:superfamily II DNA or RNA helicase
MEVIIENRIRIKNPPDILKHLLVEKLRIPNPKYAEAQASGRSIWGLDPFITNFIILPDDSIVIPRGLREWLLLKIKELNLELILIDKRTKFDHIEINSSMIKYRQYQFDAVLNMTSSSSEGILVAPAGSGKTIMGLSVVPLLGQPTLWITHTGPLADQVVERAKAFLPDIGEIGTIGAGKWDIGKVLTIGMVQTLVKDPEKLIGLRDSFGLVIIDETHHVASRTFTEVVCNLNPYYMYGLTATPYRRDGLEQLMFQAIGLTTTTIPIKSVEKYGGIIIPTIKPIYVPSAVVEGNDLQRIIKKYIVENKFRNDMIVKDVLREAKDGHYCIVLSERVRHCEILYEIISNLWPKTGIATGKNTKKVIDTQIRMLENDEITVLISTYSLLSEGFDVPKLDRGFLASPFRTEARCEQLMGRIQRTSPGKSESIIYDYVDKEIGVLYNQFSSQKQGRIRVYKRLGAEIT